MLYLIVAAVNAQIQVEDDLGRSVILQSPAKRIISLAPHVTELLFAAGASDQIVGVVSYSDYPEQARRITQIGSYNKFDMEAIVAMQPDLIVAWKSGNPDHQVEEFSKLGFNVFYSEPRQLADIAHDIKQLGHLMATSDIADVAANEYMHRLNRIQKENASKKKISVFYQVWNQPLLTVNGEHLISNVIELCGGKNVFATTKTFVPQVNVEAVIQQNPQVIIVGMNEERQDWLNEWQQWPVIQAVKNKYVFPVNADHITRHSPRILQGAEAVCRYLDDVRLGLSY